MLLENIALVPEPQDLVSMSDVTRTAAALQKQVLRDAEPLWGVQATVDAFASLDDVPTGYWPVILTDHVDAGAGVHLDDEGQPYALVEAGANHPNWTVTASHEVLEMLVDPFGRRLVAGALPPQAEGDPVVAGLSRVQYLVEVCDPSEDETFAYTVNDVLVSDFYTQNFFDPVASACVRYSFRNVIKAPREVLQGGYVSFGDPGTNHWYQVTWFSGPKPIVADLGILDIRAEGSIRSAVDRKTNKDRVKSLTHLTAAKTAAATGEAQKSLMAAASGLRRTTVKTSSTKAAMLRKAIAGLPKG
jgi:hypothetical protein